MLGKFGPTSQIRRKAIDVLAAFHPILRDWFSETYAEPTEVQALSWPRIRDGENLLITAPTGSGKTLTGFFAAIDAFVNGDLPLGQTSVLYVSPLKALNNDIERNLQLPLRSLKARFEQAGKSWPEIRTAVRSGDTPQSARQRMIRQRPEILITTPESLALILTTGRGSQWLSTISTVILDEIHDVLGSRRGPHLMVSLERLVEVTGEVQRIALSATVNPLTEVAQYVGGLDVNHQPREVGIVKTSSKKQIDLRVRFPPAVKELAENGESIWPAMIDQFDEHVKRNKSTLIFSASRRQCERTTYLLNEVAEELVAYAHHGSLSREIRSEVETRLKQGELKAIVATSSLELGIDIGELDEVILMQTPMSVASAMQRIGRAGHNVGDVSRATIYPMFARDFLDAAVIAEAVGDANIEPVSIMREPLDLLAQTIVAMVAPEDWHVDDIFEVVTRAAPYANLSRRLFDLVIEMLTGKYERTRIRDLRPRVALDAESQVLSIRKGATMALYTNGGTIPDRGYFKLKHADTNAVIGELDEEFVWETTVGKQFAFGTQQWVVADITHNDVLVRAASSKETTPPFYRSEFINKSFYYSRQVGDFLQKANDMLDAKNDHLLIAELQNRGFDDEAANELVRYLHAQRDATGCDLPHANHLVAELIDTGPSGYESVGNAKQLILHTGWGGAVNRPLALCLEAAWEERFATAPDIAVDNQVIAIQMKQDVGVDEILNMLSPDDLLPKIRRSLEKSGFFGARFRECAGRALLLAKSRFDRRMPLWLTRMQSKDLLDSVSKYEDFPILLETWRSCFFDEFDMDATRSVLDDLESGKIELSECQTSTPSPFAASIAHDQVNRYMYADDRPEGGGRVSSLSDELIAHALRDAALRPPLSKEVIDAFERKVQRRESGYEPTGEFELTEWIKERVWIRESEWFKDIGVPESIELIEEAGRSWYFERSTKTLLTEDVHAAVANAMQFYGPHSRAEWQNLLPLKETDLNQIIDDLLSTGVLVEDVVVEGQPVLCICDARNLGSLLRFQRVHSRPRVVAQPVRELPNFLAEIHCFGEERSHDDLVDGIEKLQGVVAPVRLWLGGLWRPRGGDVSAHQLSAICEQYGIEWQGRGNQRITLSVVNDRKANLDVEAKHQAVLAAFTDPFGSYSYLQLAQATGLRLEEFNELFWSAVWHGLITSDSIVALAQADEQGYKSQTGSLNRVRLKQVRLRSQARGDRPLGMWRRCRHIADENEEELEKLEINKERVRVLAGRYGIVCRELCNREGGDFRWAEIFRAVRMMELSGELLSGLFFEELSGPQFMLQSAFVRYSTIGEERRTFWVHSYDPVAPCGLGLDWPELPVRQQGNMLAFSAGELVAVSRGHGKQLDFFHPPEDQSIDEVCRTLHYSVAANKGLSIDRINGERSLDSPYLLVLNRYMQIRRGVQNVYVDALIH